MTRTRRSALSLATGFGGSAVTMAVGLVGTPLLLGWLGDERAGTHRVFTEWLGYLALLDFGLAATLQTVVARRLGVGERAGALADVRAAMRRYVGVAALQLLAVGGLGAAAPRLVAGLTDDLRSELWWGLAAVAVSLLWTPLAALRPLLDGAQQSYWVNLSLLAQSLVSVGVSLLLAWCGWGLTGQFVAVVVGGGGQAVVLLVVIGRRYPDLWRRPPATADAFPLAWPMFAFNLIGRVSVLSDAIILGLTRGAEDVVRYSLTQRLMLVAATQVMAVGNATWAALAELYHRGEMDTFRRRFLQLNRWTALLGVAAVGPLAVMNERLVGVWVGGERYGGGALNWLTCGQALLMAQAALWCWPLVGCGMVRKTLPVMLAGSGVNVAVSVGGAVWLGVVGPAIGNVAGYAAVYAVVFPLLLKREFGLPVWAVTWELPRAVLLFAPFGLAVWGCASALAGVATGSRWLDFLLWVGLAVAGGVVYLALAGWLLSSADEREFLLSRVRRR